MKSVFFLMALSVSSAAWAGYGAQDCSTTGLRVLLSQDESKLTLITNRGQATYPVVRTDSRTGDIDFTYVANRNFSLTIDDEHGDFVSLNHRMIRVGCVGR